MKRKNNFKWFGRVHEYLAVYGNTIHSDIEIYHNKEAINPSSRNLEIFLDMKNNNEPFTSRDIFYFANELFDHSLFKESAEKYELFLSTSDGWAEDKKSASFNLAKCYIHLNKQDKILPLLFNSFIYGKPRSDICCSIANTLFQNEKFEEAVFWYKTAISCKPDKYYMGFNYKEYYTFIPCIQLCVCYSYLGDYEKAFYYNELASIYQTNTELTSHNKQYLIKKLMALNLPIPSI